MTFEYISQLLKSHTSIRLLKADNAPLIISFLFETFKENFTNQGEGGIKEKELADRLADMLYVLNDSNKIYPKQPNEYLTDWANAGFLRKYPGKTDEFVYELTPATELVFKWIDSLDKREFIGTESRLKYLFERMQELVGKTQMDVTERLARLEAQKQALEQEIENIKEGKLETMDDRQIKEEYYLIEDTAKSLLADFKEVEQNFRDLDRNFRRQIITSSQSKGEVLSDLFEQQDFLSQTDQGKSFTAFWEFLLSQSKQVEFEQLLTRMLEIPVVQQIRNENFRMELLRNNLIEAGDRTNKTTNSLWGQLRKYLEHKSFFENKRIPEQISEGLKLIFEHPEIDFTKLPALEVDETIRINLIADQPLYMPPEQVKFKKQPMQEGKASGGNELLYEQFEINIPKLKDHIKQLLLRKHGPVSLPELIREYPIEKGIAEVVAYLDIASKNEKRCTVSPNEQDEILILNAQTGHRFQVKIPKIIFNQ